MFDSLTIRDYVVLVRRCRAIINATNLISMQMQLGLAQRTMRDIDFEKDRNRRSIECSIEACLSSRAPHAHRRAEKSLSSPSGRPATCLNQRRGEAEKGEDKTKHTCAQSVGGTTRWLCTFLSASKTFWMQTHEKWLHNRMLHICADTHTPDVNYILNTFGCDGDSQIARQI